MGCYWETSAGAPRKLEARGWQFPKPGAPATKGAGVRQYQSAERRRAISCPTKYFAEASSINFQKSMKHGFGTLGVSMGCFLGRLGLRPPAYLDRSCGSTSTLSVSSIRERISETNLKV